MASTSKSLIAHVFRRLGVGAHPDLIESASDTDEAISRALDLTMPSPEVYQMEPPIHEDEATDPSQAAGIIRWWLEQMTWSRCLIEERLVWFWSDHFATGLRKVRVPYLMYLQHLTIRRLAAGPFRDLLHATAVDGAMLAYLDGVFNSARSVNENYAREVMELHTLGVGNYDQADITEGARAFTGWLVHSPFHPRIVELAGDVPAWKGFFVPRRHLRGPKTVLGTTAEFDLVRFLDLLLEQPSCRRFIASKLYRHLTGIEPDERTSDYLFNRWTPEDSAIELVAIIVDHPSFLAPETVNAKVRTPVERLATIGQAYGRPPLRESLGLVLHRLDFLPLNPPNPAGFREGAVLLGPDHLIHGFDLLAAVDQPPDEQTTEEVIARLGLVDVSETTLAVLNAASSPGHRIALAANSPEMALT